LRDTDSFADVHPDDRDRIQAIFRQTVATGQGQRTEYRLLTCDGSIRFVESQGSVIRDDHGKIINVLVVSRDVTARRSAEQALREQAALLLNQRITYWNQGAEKLYGWPAAEALGRRADEMLYRRDSPQILEVRRQVMEKGEWAGELKQFTRDGREVVVQARRTLLYDEQRRPYCILNINSDITEKKLIHEQLLRTQRMESIGAMAGGIAHDLNNVLAPILMAADLVRSEVASESGQAMLDTMKSSAQRGSEMVRQILSFARGSGSKHSVLQPSHLMAEIGRFARDTFPSSIAIKSQVARDLFAVSGNPTQLHQVLLNLCVNARDAMPGGGTLWLTAENVRLRDRLFPGENQPVSGPYAVLSVADSGTGMPPDVLAKIFAPFFTTKGEGKGTGIGLSTVCDLVKTHNGFVEVESQVGVGSRFRVYLPAAVKSEALPSGTGECILVMDDELALLEITKGLLESYNYHVLTAANGADALALFHKHSSEIRGVIADMITPVMDGGALIQALNELAPQVKIIAVSGQDLNAGFSTALSPNVHACLTKPYSPEQILLALHEMLKT
jgi:PAS domain S-box-containing protein